MLIGVSEYLVGCIGVSVTWQRSICLVSANYTNKATTERKLLNYLTAIADTVC